MSFQEDENVYQHGEMNDDGRKVMPGDVADYENEWFVRKAKKSRQRVQGKSKHAKENMMVEGKHDGQGQGSKGQGKHVWVKVDMAEENEVEVDKEIGESKSNRIQRKVEKVYTQGH